MRRWRLSLAALALIAGAAPAWAEGDAVARGLYTEHCAACHGADRLGASGPALLPESLRRLKKRRARKVIAAGRAQTQMPAFGEQLEPAKIEELVNYIFSPPGVTPVWNLASLRASHVTNGQAHAAAERPIHDADPMNLFVVVESGTHHVTILDGDKLAPIHRFPSRFALHGGPKFSPDGRFVYFASRDGWISKFDLYTLETVAEVRAGINTRNLAISHDGRVVAVANYLPHTLVLLDARDLSPLKIIEVRGRDNKTTSRVSAVYQAAPRESFVLALKDLPEIWEISYAEEPPARFLAFVHNYEEGMVEAIPTKRFPILRTELAEPLDDFFFDQSYKLVFGSARSAGKSKVVNLNVRREIAEVALSGLPHLGSGITWTWRGRRVMATPHLKEAALSVIDMAAWTVIKRIETEGPGFFLRSHENTPYAWTDVFFGPNRDKVHVIDKRTLEIVRTLRPAPGKTAAHVEFTKDGRYALLSIWDMDGAIVVYDAQTLEEVKRIPLKKPSGKYNVHNKITRSEGTSH